MILNDVIHAPLNKAVYIPFILTRKHSQFPVIGNIFEYFRKTLEDDSDGSRGGKMETGFERSHNACLQADPESCS